MSQGWIKLHRRIWESDLWKERPFDRARAWIDLVLMANHETRNVVMGNEVIPVERGSLITSERKLMERWGWSKTKVRVFLNLLQSESMIIQEKDHKKTTLTVLHYCIYQDSETTEEPEEAKNHKKTTERPVTMQKKDHKKTTSNPLGSGLFGDLETTERPVKDQQPIDLHSKKRPKQEDQEDKKIRSNKRSSSKAFDEGSPELSLAYELLALIRANNRNFKEPNVQKWAADFDLISRIDKREPDIIRDVMTWAQRDNFWRSNILSPGKLRQKFDTLYMQMNRDGKSNKQPPRNNSFEAIDEWYEKTKGAFGE